MVPSPGLDVQIFITNYKPSPGSGPTTNLESEPYNPSQEILLPPSTVLHVSTPSVDMSDTENQSPITPDFDLEGFHTSEDDVLSLTNFEGDNESTLPGEDFLNQQVKIIGKARRAVLRKRRKQPPLKEEEDHASPKPRMYHYRLSRSLHGSEDTLFDNGSDADIYSRFLQEYLAPAEISNVAIDKQLHYAAKIQYPPAFIPKSFPRAFQRPRGRSNDESPLISSPTESNGYQPRLDVEEKELNDLLVVSEFARPGKPRIHRIVGDEVRGAEGSVVVACEC